MPDEGLDDAHSVISGVIDQSVDTGLDSVADPQAADYPAYDPSSQVDSTIVDDAAVSAADSGMDDLAAWNEPVADDQQPDADAGFDIFS